MEFFFSFKSIDEMLMQITCLQRDERLNAQYN